MSVTGNAFTCNQATVYIRALVSHQIGRAFPAIVNGGPPGWVCTGSRSKAGVAFIGQCRRNNTARTGPGFSWTDVTQVVVPPGGPIEIAFLSDPAFGFGASIANAVQMAVEAHPNVLGFPIQLNTVDVQACGGPGTAATAANASATAAYEVTANPQNVGVIGQICSNGFARALPIYENAGLVTVTGSATNDSLPSAAPTVFSRTVVNDDKVDAWYAVVSTLPSDLAWQQAYTDRFGTAPSEYADLYYDATSLVIGDLQRASRIDGGHNLIIDRAALAKAVRTTTDYPGVSCTITLDPATGDRLDDPVALSRCAGVTH